MGSHKLLIAGKAVRLHGCLISAEFRTQRVLCSDPWKFVALWLKRDHKNDALFYWEQAHHFYTASQSLPELSSPLTSFYCFLNATKALLSAKNVSFKELHGVGGRSIGQVKSLDNEYVDFQGSGILPALCKYLEEPENAGKEFTLKDIFWQIPLIHRAFRLTYKGATELFIPLANQCFMRKDGSQEAWFQAEIDRPYINSHIKKVIEPGFDLYKVDGKYEVRKKKRFKWSGHDIENSIEQFTKYHKQIRKRIIPKEGSDWSR